MKIKLYQIDAFIINGKPFTGNPATVCLLDCDDDISDQTKQGIAEEVNQSMTAFVSNKWTKTDSIDNTSDKNVFEYKIRFFTPTKELDLCGHASVASSLILAKTIKNKLNYTPETINLLFESKSKVILEALVEGSNNLITLSMPLIHTKQIPTNQKWIQDMVENTLGPNLDSKSIVEEICVSNKFVLIRLKDNSIENSLSTVLPNFDNLIEINKNNNNSVRNGIIVTQRSNHFDGNQFDFYSRVFLPFVGVNEDPVCGSAHTLLTPYWRQRLMTERQLTAKQCSQRTGLLYCSIKEDKVLLTGNAIVIYEGIIFS